MLAPTLSIYKVTDSISSCTTLSPRDLEIPNSQFLSPSPRVTEYAYPPRLKCTRVKAYACPSGISKPLSVISAHSSKPESKLRKESDSVIARGRASLRENSRFDEVSLLISGDSTIRIAHYQENLKKITEFFANIYSKS